MRERSPRLCPHCYQPLLPLRYGVAFGPVAVRIIDAAANAGARGIRFDDLVIAAYGAVNVDTRGRLRSYIGRINSMLTGRDVWLRGNRNVYRIATRRPQRERHRA